MAASIVDGNTLLAQLNDVTRSDTGAAITTGVTVTAQIYRAGVLVAEVTMTHSAGGDWSGVINAPSALVVGERLDVKWLVDGGVSLRGTWWERGVRVLERAP